ncbi:MAG: flagellar hook capping FlgD N-terminal domain-containing protein [Candidatus Sumerlaeia bacterium]
MSIASISASTQKTTTTESASDGLGKNDFLQLMIAQLQNQDPLDPADATEYTSQLCQYSSLEQLINANDNIETLTSSIESGSRTSAASYIGREVTVSGNQVTLDNGTASGANFVLASDAETVSVNVYDGNNELVDTVSLGDLDSGTHTFTWDGKKSSGAAASDGTYTFKVVATGSDGTSVTVAPTFTGTVDSIEFENGNTMLNIGGGSWPVSSVVSIGNTAS